MSRVYGLLNVLRFERSCILQKRLAAALPNLASFFRETFPRKLLTSFEPVLHKTKRFIEILLDTPPPGNEKDRVHLGGRLHYSYCGMVDVHKIVTALSWKSSSISKEAQNQNLVSFVR